ncbi:unnamed protein product [Pseudo-nitzschia multistriata]|uniref:Uncharacterized protein n=1 Tax=Pseudo-nitzschia multistriata TaxID=183589 RepID=A0A448YYP9_9STRA|nr:unnamed protein product [Pseudo-nitzschia multistriata]
MASVATGVTTAMVLRHSLRHLRGCQHCVDQAGVRSGSTFRLRNHNPPLRTLSSAKKKTEMDPTEHRSAKAWTSAFGDTSEDDRENRVQIGEDFLGPAAVGRSRKRPRPWRSGQRNAAPSFSTRDGQKSATDTVTSVDSKHRVPTSSIDSSSLVTSEEPVTGGDLKKNDESLSLPYPKGKPWRVLFPYPHGEPTKSPRQSLWDFHKRIPSLEQLRRAWELYKKTWEDGIQGNPTERNDENDVATKVSSRKGGGDDGDYLAKETEQQLREIGDNATKNLNAVRKDAQNLLEHAKETTGIYTQDDAKALASEAMKIATECIREFMGGYRKGRDSEIDKMLHEYFQEEDNNNARSKGENTQFAPESAFGKNGDRDSSDQTILATKRRRKKRKPKRGIPRT